MVLRKSFYIHWSAGRSPRVHEVNPGRDPSSNPLPTYSTQAVPSPMGGIHSIDFVETEDRIHMLSWDDQRSEPIAFDDGYSDDGVCEVFSSQ